MESLIAISNSDRLWSDEQLKALMQLARPTERTVAQYRTWLARIGA
jgi:hypothetical protein